MDFDDAGRQDFEARLRLAIGLSGLQRVHMPGKAEETMGGTDITFRHRHVGGDGTSIGCIAAIAKETALGQSARFLQAEMHFVHGSASFRYCRSQASRSRR